MEVENSHFYECDSKLKLGDENFGQKLNKDHYDEDAAHRIAFPSDYTLAIFAELAYEEKYYLVPHNWELLTTATNTDTINGYYGVAFWNPKLCQIVIAHRGTKLSNPGALISDVQLALNKAKTPQSQSAASFVHIVSEEIKKQNKIKGPSFQLSITGHSLGAWLAQVTTFTTKYFKQDGKKFVEDKEYLRNIHAHTVVFESPGCRETLAKLAQTFVPRYAHRKYGNYDILDMTVYLSKLNPINTVNQHVGTIYYAVHSKTHSIKEIVELFDRETHKIEREVVLDFRSGMYASCKLLIKKLLPISSTKKYKTKRANDNEHSLNVFTEDELDFVRDWVHIIKHDSPNVEEFKHKNSLPDFQVDFEFNTIKADNLNEAIARVKRLNPTKTVIFKLLQNDVHEKVYSEVFKLEVHHFQKSLLEFKNYSFKDKYNLREFLKSEDQILHICVDSNSKLEYELETSILNSVLTVYQKNEKNESTLIRNYFKQNQYCFLNWNKLRKVQSFLPKILGKGNDKVNLLVIECFEASEGDEETILKFLHECSNAKIIVISTDQFSWTEENNIKEIFGFGSNITFQDLTEISQKEFISQQNLILHGRKYSLNDIINVAPLNDEVYEHLNKAIPVRVLLEFMLTPLSETQIMDCPYNNLLTTVVFLDLYREIQITRLTENYEEALFVIQDKNNHGLSESDRIILEESKGQDIKIQYDISFEKECLENLNLKQIVYLFTVESGNLFLTKIFNRKFYVPRYIIHKKTVSSCIFKDCNEDLDQYYICGNKDKFKEMISYLNNDQKEHFKFVLSAETGKEIVQNAKTNAHLLKIDETKVEWLYSRGNMDSLRRNMQLNVTSVKEIEIMDNERVVIISGEPGIGKSSTIGHLFLQLKQTHWVFAVSLKHSAFDNLSDKVNFDSAAKFIINSCGISDTHYIQHLLSYCLKNKTNLPIYLMFDAYDEIQEEKSKQKFITLVNFLKDFSTANILITTRKYTCRELENGIFVFASQYEELDQETDVIDFFAHFRYSQLRIFEENIDIEDIKRTIPSILENVQTVFGETISNFIGMPMQMRMIAEVLTPSNSSSTASSITLVDILGLYQKYTEIRYNIYFKRIGLLDNETVKIWLSESISGKLYKLAIIKTFNLNKENVDYNDVKELNKVGLIQSDRSNYFYYEFLHDSVCDYFIAYLLKLWLESHFEIFHHGWDVEQFIVSDFLLKGEFKEIRFFLNCYLKNLTVSNHRLEICQNKLQHLWEHDQSLFFNDDQESFFHVCAKENLCFLSKHFLFKIVNNSNQTKLFSKRNSDFKTPLLLANGTADDNLNNVKNMLSIFLEELNEWQPIDIKTVFLATLFTYSDTSMLLDTINKYSKYYTIIAKIIKEVVHHSTQINGFLDSCKFDDLSKMNSILDQFQNDTITRDYLLLTTNERKESCLHLTSSKEIVKRLLKLGVDKNLQDHHGMTPLTRAIKKGNTDIAMLLIKQGALHIGDFVGYSPLLHAAKYNNLEVIQLLLSSENPNIDHHNVFHVTALMIAAKNGNENVTRYLLDKGADVSVADWNGMTPLYHAVKGNHTKLISIFRKKGADLNIPDQQGITPLLYSIMKNRWDMVNSLLDNGADINIRSSRNTFPLKLLIKKDKRQIIKKVLQQEVKKTKDATIFIREAARIDILTEEEEAYISNLTN